jgi:hypothetical protein
MALPKASGQHLLATIWAVGAVARWRETAAATGLTAREIERMASTFEHG